MAKLKITLIHSAAHRLPNERRIVKSLGLNRINSTTTKKDTAALRGALFKITHLVKVELVK
ncbi:50S ribosomal protein L30 [Acetilactobacillus jinshanensis]|uniref:Large ribosomal subunit protein uL30 n=1 Tax=Acetilactobacillus jinshanensis TaxID=1720083 RepID=A0A4P6ZJD1_9LACO|nr:50S ribosomal protein L30 [Acetilactobacillus jinshanensis]QBP17841.1 50S ribosomal protein L30 [Acetilactobacillus jinshanensis]URL60702.1 50S ribosomal protein L30 [uncultured bacterium]